MAELNNIVDPKVLTKGYDAIANAIRESLQKVNKELADGAAEYEKNQQILAQTTSRKKINMTSLGALDFLSEAFKALPKNKTKMNDQQKFLNDYMNIDESGKHFTTFKVDEGTFWEAYKKQFKLADTDIEEIRRMIMDSRTKAEKAANETMAQAMSKAGNRKATALGATTKEIQMARLPAVEMSSEELAAAQKNVEQYEEQRQQAAATAAVLQQYSAALSEARTKQAELKNNVTQANTALQQEQNILVNAARGSAEFDAQIAKANTQLLALQKASADGKAKLEQLQGVVGKLQGASNFVNRYLGIYAIIRKVSTAVKNAIANIKDLDKTITNIAVVTNMSQEDLWGQVGEYTQRAQQYGVAVKDVYAVSQIFYQQGLQTAQVMELTTETLKMAKIAGLDYKDAADAMTVAIRAFKIEMSDAQQVTDTYSALAAKFAVSSAELANAMEKTASSAASVGMTLQSTSAFMSVMVQTTRESAQNIGSALKSIISRYGEMKASPSQLINVDGEEASFNKVDTALKSIGISIKDAAGQFRNFDDVIMELAKKWDTLDNNTQRYIATIMAGNRQQSRFIALVSNYDELNRAMQTANNAENASAVQVAKTLDSLESKINQAKNAWQQLYLSLGVEKFLKDTYDWITRIFKTIGNLGWLKGVIPTLMNIIGLGTALKKTFSGISQLIQNKKKKVEVDTDDATRKAEELQKELEKVAVKKVEIQVDNSALEKQKLEAQSKMQDIQEQVKDNITKKGQQKFDFNKMQEAWKDATRDENGNITAEARDKLIKDFGIYKKEGSFEQITSLMDSFDKLKETSDVLSEQIENNNEVYQEAIQSVKDVSDGMSGAAQATDKLKDTSEGVSTAEQTQEQSIRSNQIATDGEAQSKNNDKQKTEEHSVAVGRDTDATRNRANALSKSIGIASIVTRLAGTAITAAGAAHKDTIGESFLGYSGTNGNGVEKSKIITSIGNGLSMGGTGVSLGAMIGSIIPGIGTAIGAVVGGIGGLLAGGLGGLIDGLTLTLTEKIKMQEEELEEAKQESLKAQAKSTDLSSALENIKQLRSAMYNSTDDMKKYKDAMNTLADQYPQLIESYDEQGNAILDLQDAEKLLANIRMQGTNAALEEAKKRSELLKSYKTAVTKAAITFEQNQTPFNETASEKNPNYILMKDKNGNLQSIKSIMPTINSYGTKTDFNYYQQYREIYNFLRSNKNSSTTKYQKSFDELTFEEYSNFARYFAEAEDENRHPIQVVTADNGEIYRLPSSWNPEAYINEMMEDFQDEAGNEALVSLKSLNEVITQFSSQGIDIFGNITSVAQLIGEDAEVSAVSVKKYKKIQSLMLEMVEKYEKSLQANNKIIDYYLAEQEINNASLNLNDNERTRLQTNSIYTQLLTQQLMSTVEFQGGRFQSLADWKEQKSQQFETILNDTSDAFLAWYTHQSSITKERLESLDFTQFLSSEQVLSYLGLRNDDVYAEAIGGLFTEYNKANIARIQDTILSNNEINGDLTGLQKLNSDIIKSIVNTFNEENGTIISKYADYFTTQLLEIDKLADQGYTALANGRLRVLNDLKDTLAGITDSATQNDLFGIITNIDFTNYDSIQKAIEAFQTYGKTIHNMSLVNPFINKLEKAAENLIFNIVTLSEEVTSTLQSVAKDIESLMTANKSGFDLSSALEALKKIQAYDSNKTFNDIFEYNDVLGKYVYSVNGLREAITTEEAALEEKNKQLQQTYAHYFGGTNKEGDAISGLNIKKVSEITSQTNWVQAALESTEDIYLQQALKEFESSKEFGKKVQDEYGNIIDYSNSFTGFSNWYSEIFAAQMTEATTQAQQQYEQYRKDKAHTYFAQIDWSALKLNTDASGINETYAKLLMEQLELTGKHTYDEIIRAYIESLGYTQDTPEYQNDYRRITSQVQAGERSQVTTAISELLEGAGTVLSDTTIGLLERSDELKELYNKETGKLDKNGADFVESALQLFAATENILTTVQEKNSTYVSIISKKFERANNAISAITSGASMDLSTVEALYNSLGETLYKNEEGQIKLNTESWWSIDQFGKAFITDWQQFETYLSEKLGDNWSKLQNSFEYQNAYASYVDGVIKLDEQMTSLVNGQLSKAVGQLNVGGKINVSQLNGLPTSILTQNGAATIVDGQLTINNAVKYAANVVDFYKTVSNLNDQELYDLTGWTREDLAKNWKSATETLTAYRDAWTGISDSLMNLSTDNISTLISSGNLNINDIDDTFSKVGDHFVLSLEKYGEKLAEALDGGKDNSLYNQYYEKAQKTIADKLTGISWDKLITGTATTFEMSEAKEAFTDALYALGKAFNEEAYTLILQGGQAAINVIYGNGLGDYFNDEAIKTIYETQSKKLADSFETVLSANVGSVVDETTALILEKAGYSVKHLGDSKNYVVYSSWIAIVY